MSKAAELAALIASGQAQGNKNLIINGDMQCWQRATAATAVTNAYATVDRFRFVEGTAGAYTSERSTDSPIGTGYSLKLQVTTADASMASGDYAYFQQVVEAQNLQPLQYGTSSAKTLTLSFWVKSSKTGTYAIALVKADSTQYNFVHEYTISSANTWEKKTITISPTAGSTSFITSAAGGINNDNGVGFYVVWMLCSGTDLNGATNNAWSSNGLHYTTTNQVNWMDSTSNNFYLSQVQLEIGEVATAFEHEDFATTLYKCQRYYQVVGDYRGIYTGSRWTSTQIYATYPLACPLRASPALSTGGAFPVLNKYDAAQSASATALVASAAEAPDAFNTAIVLVYTLTGYTPVANNVYQVSHNGATTFVVVDSEL